MRPKECISHLILMCEEMGITHARMEELVGRHEIEIHPDGRAWVDPGIASEYRFQIIMINLANILRRMGP